MEPFSCLQADGVVVVLPMITVFVIIGLHRAVIMIVCMVYIFLTINSIQVILVVTEWMADLYDLLKMHIKD